MLSRVNRGNTGRKTGCRSLGRGKSRQYLGGAIPRTGGIQTPLPMERCRLQIKQHPAKKPFNQRDAAAPPPLKDELLLFLYVIRLYLLAMRKFLLKTTDCENQKH
jgi:hypothetical protein